MTDFLSKLFSNPKKENNHLGEASLMQGARFNKMQRAIERPVYSHLPLMEQTTGSGFGSIKEPLENNSQLPKLDDKELKELSKMENEYERLITQLKNIQSVNLKTVIGMKKMSDLESQIKKLNTQIMRKANKIVKQTYKTNNTTNELNKYNDSQRSDLKGKIDELMKRKHSYDALVSQKNSLDGQHEDKQNELDAVYLHYIVWFIAATTLGVLTVHQLSK